MVFAGQTIPFVLMPHFVSPGQVRRVKHAVTVLCRVLDRFCDAYPTDARTARRAPAPRHRGLADPHRPGLPAPDAHLPARRLPAGLRRQVPRVQRRLPRRRRLHRHPLRGPAHDDRPPARAPGVRHHLHADPARADHDAARRLRARPRHPHRPAGDARGSRSSTPTGSPSRPRVPHHLRRRQGRRHRGRPRHARGGHLRRHARSTSRASRSSSSTAARCWRTSTSPTSSPPRATAASASSTRSARASPTTRSCSRSSRTRASPTSSTATRPTSSGPRSRGRGSCAPAA